MNTETLSREEEILKEHCDYSEQLITPKQALSAMREYAKEMSIGYDLWKIENEITFKNGKYQRWIPFDYKQSKALIYYTPDEMYNAYLKHLSSLNTKQP